MVIFNYTINSSIMYLKRYNDWEVHWERLKAEENWCGDIVHRSGMFHGVKYIIYTYYYVYIRHYTYIIICFEGYIIYQ